MFKIEDKEYHESEDPFEGREGRPSSPCLYQYYPTSCSRGVAQLCKIESTEGYLKLPFETAGGFPQFRSTGTVICDVFQGPFRDNGSCDPGTAGGVGRRQGEREEARRQRWWK